MNLPGHRTDDPHDPTRLGFSWPEELQAEPEPPRRGWGWTWALLGIALAAGLVMAL